MKALELARYIILKSHKDGCPVSNLQLQKTLYFIQRGFLQQFNVPAFDEPVEAWPFGPVVAGVYYNYSGYGGMKIPVSEGMDMMIDEKTFVDRIITECINKPPWELVRQAHEAEGAWDRTYCNGKGYKDVISLEDIKKFRAPPPSLNCTHNLGQDK